MIQIRRIHQTDVDVLVRLSRHTFSETFSAQNSSENLQNYLNTQLSHETLLVEIQNPESEFYLCDVNHEPVGYLKVNFGRAQTEEQVPGSMEIERIYVLRSYQGEGIAQRLFQMALDRARDTAMTRIWLGVWEENPRAIAFYRKLGFIEFGSHVFQLGSDAQRDILMELHLEA